MEHITTILTNPTFWSNTPMFILLVIIFAILLKVLKVRVNTSHVQIGGETKEAFYERKIVQEQSEYARAFLFGLVGEIKGLCPNHELLFDGWMLKCILEEVYDEFVDMIHHNHIRDGEAYISVKQAKICAIVYSNPVRDPFRTSEFKERMDRWIAEIIKELMRIRKVTSEEMKKGQI